MQDLITEEQNSFIRTCKDGWGDLTYIWQMPAECKMYPTPLGLSVLHGGTSLSCPSSPSKEIFRLKKKKVLVYLFPVLEVFTDRNYSSLPRDNIHVYVSFLVIIRMLFGLKIQGADIQNWICKVAMQPGTNTHCFQKPQSHPSTTFCSCLWIMTFLERAKAACGCLPSQVGEVGQIKK